MQFGMKQQDLAVASGYWPLFRYNPAMREVGRQPVPARQPAPDAARSATTPTTRCATRSLAQTRPDDARRLLDAAQAAIVEKYRTYEEMAGWSAAASIPPAWNIPPAPSGWPPVSLWARVRASAGSLQPARRCRRQRQHNLA